MHTHTHTHTQEVLFFLTAQGGQSVHGEAQDQRQRSRLAPRLGPQPPGLLLLRPEAHVGGGEQPLRPAERPVLL